MALIGSSDVTVAVLAMVATLLWMEWVWSEARSAAGECSAGRTVMRYGRRVRWASTSIGVLCWLGPIALVVAGRLPLEFTLDALSVFVVLYLVGALVVLGVWGTRVEFDSAMISVRGLRLTATTIPWAEVQRVWIGVWGNLVVQGLSGVRVTVRLDLGGIEALIGALETYVPPEARPGVVGLMRRRCGLQEH